VIRILLEIRGDVEGFDFPEAYAALLEFVESRMANDCALCILDTDTGQLSEWWPQNGPKVVDRDEYETLKAEWTEGQVT
jgi:hypothetical protein